MADGYLSPFGFDLLMNLIHKNAMNETLNQRIFIGTVPGTLVDTNVLFVRGEKHEAATGLVMARNFCVKNNILAYCFVANTHAIYLFGGEEPIIVAAREYSEAYDFMAKALAQFG